MIVQYEIDRAGFHRYIWEQPSGMTYYFKFKEQKTEDFLAAFANEKEDAEEFINEETIIDAEHYEAARELIRLFKDRPSMTANQFSTYLSTRPWYVEYEIKYLMYVIATKLADKKDIVLSDMTESQMYLAVRNFIANAPLKRLVKLLLNQLNTDI